jgi:4-hydroxy-3-polyprenylbenzoate decarboxylase
MRGNRGYADLHEPLQRLRLPPPRPKTPWFGYSLGDWNETSDDNARSAAQGRAMARRESYRQRRRRGIAPNTPTRTIEESKDDE